MRLRANAWKQFSRYINTYTTTPIFYANAEPHIGHAYTALIADTAHRWQKLRFPFDDHVFSTGTDEHGSKIFRTAQNAKREPKEFCDEVSKKFSKLFEVLGLSNTHFIRTTGPSHIAAVQHFWTVLQENGHIYKNTYSGYYSIVDECFYKKNEIEDKRVGENNVKVVKGTATVVEWIEEENYMFKLSTFRDPIRNWLTSADVVIPKNYLSTALSYFEMDEDLSISRCKKRLSWGIPVPNDSSQTIYVWLDALVNYLTVAGYPAALKTWPPSCQVIGKDILKFHAFYWPAFLLGAHLPLPKTLFVHGHWLVDNVKMSKSLGNVVSPYDSIEKYTAEGLRYFLLKQGNPHDDSNFSASICLDIVNSDLVNNVGNLLSRSTVNKLNSNKVYFRFQNDEISPKIKEEAESLLRQLDEIQNVCASLYDEMLFYKVIEALMAVTKEANRFFQASAPWKLKDRQELSQILYVTYESLRIASILLQPVVPQFSNFCLNRLGIDVSCRRIEDAKVGAYAGGDLGADEGVVLERLDKQRKKVSVS